MRALALRSSASLLRPRVRVAAVPRLTLVRSFSSGGGGYEGRKGNNSGEPKKKKKTKRSLLDRQADLFIDKAESEKTQGRRMVNMKQELDRTVMSDMRKLVKEGNKLFTAEDVLLPRKECGPPFPDVATPTLAGGAAVELGRRFEENDATLVLCSFRYAESLLMATTWRAPFDEDGPARDSGAKVRRSKGGVWCMGGGARCGGSRM
jgi:hypothetical protein